MTNKQNIQEIAEYAAEFSSIENATVADNGNGQHIIAIGEHASQFLVSEMKKHGFSFVGSNKNHEKENMYNHVFEPQYKIVVEKDGEYVVVKEYMDREDAIEYVNKNSENDYSYIEQHADLSEY